MSGLIAIEEARERVLAEVRPLGDRGRGRWSARSAGCWPRTCPRRRTCRRSTARPWTASRSWPGPRPSCRWWASPAPGTPSRAWWSAAWPCASPRARWCPRAPTRWCRWSGPRRRASACAVPALEPGTNIRRAGEDMRAGELVLRTGDVLGPAELGVAASAGRAELSCAARPRVALVVTGDELVRPGEPLAPGHDLQLERVRPGRPGGAGRRGAGLARERGRQRRGHTRRARAGARRGRRRMRLGRRVRGPARPRAHRDGRPRRGGALLGREAESRKADLVRGARRDAGVRSAGQPGVGDGHLPALRAAGAGGPAGGGPGRSQDHGRAGRGRGPQPAARRGGARAHRAERGRCGRRPRVPRAPTSSPRCSAPTGSR